MNRSKGSLASLSLGVALLFLSVPAHAEEATRPGQISVSATGTATAAPDIALLSLSVVRDAYTARDALDANNAAMAEIVAEMKKEGVEPGDLQTAGISIEPKYFYPKRTSKNPEPPRIIGYFVRNRLTVRVRDLDKIGALLDRSVTLGANDGGQIQFMVENTDDLLEVARETAAQKAIQKAKTLTMAAGVSLGRVLSITEDGGYRPPRPKMLARNMAADIALESSVPVQAGEADYQVTVNITYELDQ